MLYEVSQGYNYYLNSRKLGPFEQKAIKISMEIFFSKPKLTNKTKWFSLSKSGKEQILRMSTVRLRWVSDNNIRPRNCGWDLIPVPVWFRCQLCLIFIRGKPWVYAVCPVKAFSRKLNPGPSAAGPVIGRLRAQSAPHDRGRSWDCLSLLWASAGLGT